MAKSGTPFEIEVRNFMQAKVNLGVFGDPNLIRVRHKQPYYSDKRKGDIITDVSLEFYRTAAKLAAGEFWLLWVIECKDLGHNVPVDDVEEFDSKMDQMNVHKGTIAARSGFAAGCIEFAKNSGIGLVRFPTPGVEKVLLEHEEVFSAKAILEGAPENKFFGDFAGCAHNGEPTFTFNTFIQGELDELFDQTDEEE